MGCGAIIVYQLFPGALPALAIALVFGGVISVMIYAVGHISGAHFNPAVSIAFCLVRHLPLKRLAGYVTAQVLGAIAAATLLGSLLGWVGHDFGVTQLAASVSIPAGFGLEFILTFLLMFVIISVATDTRAVGEMAGLAIGTTVGIGAFVGGPLTGASMNPARSLGPALISGQLEHLWLYLAAPILGAALGAFSYERLRCRQEAKEGNSGSCC